MNKESESCVFIGILFLLLPYLLTVLIQGISACPVSRQVSMEEYVAAVTASQISWEYSKETIKAQTVIARTNLYLKQREGKESELIQSAAQIMQTREMKDKMLQQFQIFQEAATETEGQVLKFNDEIKEVPYHPLSSGRTREGKEVLGEAFSYIPSVETSKDVDSPLYVEGCYFSFKELEKRLKKEYSAFQFGDEEMIEVKVVDSAGYVMEIQVGNQEFQGEKLKELLGLPSACFTVQKLGQEVRFLCKGIGHGMGMSQYAAQKMAEEGKQYTEILEYFFPEMEIKGR